MDLNNLNFTQVITNALSGDRQIRQEAENTLSLLATQNFAEFLYKLATELADEAKSTQNRQLAATYMKNCITKSDKLREAWLSLDNATKDNIKLTILSCLASNSKEIRRATGSVIAGICKVDLPLTEKWPGLINSLCQNLYNENISLRLAAIETLGYICEELTVRTIDSETVDAILSGLIGSNEGYISLKENVVAILKALNKAIHLAKKNFSNKVKSF
jgi:importin subunit beta-1